MRNLIYRQLRPVRDTALGSQPALRSYTATAAAADDDDDHAAVDALPTSPAVGPPVMHGIQMHFNGPFVMSACISIS